MSTTIESLELEISTNSKSAVSGIDALTQSLEKLRAATKGGVGLSSVAKQVTNVASAANGINSGAANNVSGLARAIQLLGGTKLSSSIANQITAISKSIQSADFTGGEAKMRGLVDALSPLSSLGKTNLSSYVSNLKKLPETFKELDKIDMTSVKVKIQELASAFKPLGDEMLKVSNGFSAFPSKIQKLLNVTNRIPKSNKRAADSFTDLYFKGKSTADLFASIGEKIWSAVSESNDYTENMNLFGVAMGKYATTARLNADNVGEAMGEGTIGALEYAENVSEALGIDTSEWVRNQGIFMTMATGFGVAGDRASVMSKNLTQLGYDLASFYNMDVDDAMTKLKSGLAGELEPLRAIGYDLSQAKLEATALSLGIDKSVDSMTQAEKAQLRYHAILSQVTTAQGDMARTLDDPANQLRVLKAQFSMATREIGNAFIPALQAILPYAIALVKVIRILANSIASLVGYKPPDLGESTDKLVENTDAMNEGLEKGQEEAKKLKSYMLGFDELNVINPNSDSAGDKPSQFEFPLKDYSDQFLANIANTGVDKIVEKMKEWLGITEDIDSWSDVFETKLGRILTSVGLVGAALLLWKLSDTFLAHLGTLSITLGAVLLIDSILVTFQEGLSWESIIGGALGGAMMGAGIGFKLGGWKGAIGGMIIGIGLSLVINGITSMLSEGVDIENVATTIIGLLTTAGGIITVVKLFNKNHKSPNKEFDTVTDTFGEVSEGTSKITDKLKGLVKNLALGLVIIVEVAAAAILITGAIWILGKELEQVGIAWQPVIDNAGTVATAMGVGVGLLAAVGVVTALLGSVGKPLITNIALGTLILAELGVATILFVAEILVIGLLLDEVGKAWEPVLQNGETIKTGIVTGTALLVGIGVVTALLGAATVASAGALPIAIGLGTAMLVLLSVAFVAFTDSLVDVANQLKDKLHPALDEACKILPDVTTNMSAFTDFMSGFAGEVVKYSRDSAVAGIASTIEAVIGFFTKDPIKQMTKEVKSQKTQFDDLIEELEDVIPKIKRAIELQTEYNTKMSEFSKVQGNSGGGGGFLSQIVNGIGSLFSGRSTDANTISSVSIPMYATGGFPEQGQMFIAQEAGAEMVGTIGRKTAVANNDQIVSGIAGGVAEANEEQNALLREQNSLLRALLDKDTSTYLDGKRITDSVEKHQRERGRVLITGGVM